MTMKCDCGGHLHVGITPSFDFSALAGLPVICERAPCLRCDTCGYETLRGDVIDSVFAALTRAVLRRPHGLLPAEITYLRKELRMSPAELAERLKVTEELVSAWEAGHAQMGPELDRTLRELANSDPQVAIATEVPEHVTQAPRATAPRRPSSGKSARFVIPGDELDTAVCSAR